MIQAREGRGGEGSKIDLRFLAERVGKKRRMEERGTQSEPKCAFFIWFIFNWVFVRLITLYLYPVGCLVLFGW